MTDQYLQLTGAEFEYPRSDLPPSVRFVGPLLPSVTGFNPPPWWSELDGDRPVVLVTQGTVANRKLDDLIGPAIEALAGTDPAGRRQTDTRPTQVQRLSILSPSVVG